MPPNIHSCTAQLASFDMAMGVGRPNSQKARGIDATDPYRTGMPAKGRNGSILGAIALSG